MLQLMKVKDSPASQQLLAGKLATVRPLPLSPFWIAPATVMMTAPQGPLTQR